MSKPKFSIITIALNSEATIRTTIESVLQQTYSSFEYLILDGGSTDSTLTIAREYEDRRVRIFEQKDRGISDAMNKGIEKASGEWVGIIHSDDWYFPNALEDVNQWTSSSSARWAYGQCDYVSSSGDFIFRTGRPFSLSRMKRVMAVPHPAVFVKRSFYRELGTPFSEAYRFAMDYDLCLRMALVEEPVFISRTIATMRLGGTSSRDQQAETNCASEVLKIKNIHLPREKVWNFSYFVFSILKIRARYLLNRFGFGKIFVNSVRKITNL